MFTPKNIICHFRETRVCSDCDTEKPFSDFNSWTKKSGKVVTRPECRRCHSKKVATKRLEKLLEVDDRYGQCSNEDCLRIQRKNKDMTCVMCECLIDD